MNISIRTLGDISIVEIAGVIDSASSGQLYDALVNIVAGGDAKVAVDLSELRFLTRAGVRGIIVAAKLAKSGGGELRICGADRPVEVFLEGLGFDHLLRFDDCIEASIARLSRLHTEKAPQKREIAISKQGRWKIRGFGVPKDRPVGPPETGPAYTWQ